MSFSRDRIRDDEAQLFRDVDRLQKEVHKRLGKDQTTLDLDGIKIVKPLPNLLEIREEHTENPLALFICQQSCATDLIDENNKVRSLSSLPKSQKSNLLDLTQSVLSLMSGLK